MIVKLCLYIFIMFRDIVDDSSVKYKLFYLWVIPHCLNDLFSCNNYQSMRVNITRELIKAAHRRNKFSCSMCDQWQGRCLRRHLVASVYLLVRRCQTHLLLLHIRCLCALILACKILI